MGARACKMSKLHAAHRLRYTHEHPSPLLNPDLANSPLPVGTFVCPLCSVLPCMDSLRSMHMQQAAWLQPSDIVLPGSNARFPSSSAAACAGAPVHRADALYHCMAQACMGTQVSGLHAPQQSVRSSTHLTRLVRCSVSVALLVRCITKHQAPSSTLPPSDACVPSHVH